MSKQAGLGTQGISLNCLIGESMAAFNKRVTEYWSNMSAERKQVSIWCIVYLVFIDLPRQGRQAEYRE